jgi:hypothetical protein
MTQKRPADVAQLVERRLAKAKVAGSRPVVRSILITSSPSEMRLGFFNAFRVFRHPNSRGRCVKCRVMQTDAADKAHLSFLVVLVAGAGLPAVLPPLFLVVSSVGIVSTTSFSLA